MMPICTGSDGGGSIRIPSSYSGLFGFKVSFGRVGNDGPFDNSLTSVPGPICRSVRDAARYVDAIAGPTVDRPDVVAAPAAPLRGLRCVSGDARRSVAGQARRVVVDARLRGVRSRSREARARSRARARRRRGPRARRRRRRRCPKPSGARGESFPVSKCRATTAKRPRGRCRRRHAGVARRLRADRAA